MDCRITASREQPNSGGAWILDLTVEDFRGIPGVLAIELSAASAPGSAVILGDNGSGKPSLVDAMQLALQGAIRGVGFDNPAKYGVSRLTERLPKVRVSLSDGRTVSQDVYLADDGNDLRVRQGPSAGFGQTPLVVRRSDILRFWDTPSSQRQLIFVSYFTAGARDLQETPHEQAARLEGERIEAKTARNDAIQRLADAIGVERRRIPSGLAGFNDWVDRHFHGGRDRRSKRLRSFRRLPPDQWTAISDARQSIKDLRMVDGQVERAKRRAGSATGRPDLKTILGDASDEVTRAFNAISPSASIEGFRMDVGGSSAVALDLRLVLSNGREANPRAVLSEANRDLIALLIFVAVAKAAAENGQARVLLLDDVFQSVDAPIRVAAVDYLLSDLKGWQFLVTAHDRLWREQLRTIFQRHSIPLADFEITGWTPEGGPAIRAGGSDPSYALRAAIDAGDPVAMAIHSGRLLEQISDTLSWTLGVSVTRRRGDRYSLGDLWPPVFKVLRRTNVAPPTEEIDRHLHLRNLLGAHANAWAESVSVSESRRFAKAVLLLLASARCPKCVRWVEPSPTRHTWTCRCGATRIERPKD